MKEKILFFIVFSLFSTYGSVSFSDGKKVEDSLPRSSFSLEGLARFVEVLRDSHFIHERQNINAEMVGFDSEKNVERYESPRSDTPELGEVIQGHEFRRARNAQKMFSENEPDVQPFSSSLDVPRLEFSSGYIEPTRGIDDRLFARSRSQDAEYTYGFLIPQVIPDQELFVELENLGLEILGRHGDSIKVKVPLNEGYLRRVANHPLIYWLGFPELDQKIDRNLSRFYNKDGLSKELKNIEEVPIIINVFDEDNAAFRREIENLGVTITRYYPSLLAYKVVSPVGSIRNSGPKTGLIAHQPSIDAP